MGVEDIKILEKEWQNAHGVNSLKKSFSLPGTRAVFECQYEKIINAFMPLNGGRNHVLEVGCGIGKFIRTLSERYPQLDIVGVDISVNSLKEAQKNVYGNTKLLLADGENLPFGKNQFDIIIYEGVVHHFPDYQLALSEAYRVLTPNGKVIIYEPISTPFTRFIRHLFGITGRETSDIESPIDLDFKDRFTKANLFKAIANVGFKIEDTYFCDFLAYPLTGGYKPTIFSKSKSLMNKFLQLEQKLESNKFISLFTKLLCWRMLIVLTK